MPDTEKTPARKKNGTFLAIAIVLICGLGAGLTALRYSTQAVSTADARLLYDGKVLATVRTHDARNIREGMRATVTVDGYDEQKFLGLVELIQPDTETETLVMIRLTAPPKIDHPPVDCQVTVDTSLPPELLK